MLSVPCSRARNCAAAWQDGETIFVTLVKSICSVSSTYGFAEGFAVIKLLLDNFDATQYSSDKAFRLKAQPPPEKSHAPPDPRS